MDVQYQRGTLQIECACLCQPPVNLLLDHGRHLARLRRRHCAHTPTSNTAKHDNHEKINWFMDFHGHLLFDEIFRFRDSGCSIMTNGTVFSGGWTNPSQVITFQVSGENTNKLICTCRQKTNGGQFAFLTFFTCFGVARRLWSWKTWCIRWGRRCILVCTWLH